MQNELKTDAVIIALLQNGSQRKAAQALGVALSTLQNYMKQPAFKDAYTTTRAELLQATYNSMLNDIVDVTNTLKDIIKDESNAPQIKINACNLYLNTVLKMHENVAVIDELEDMKVRLQEVEAEIEKRN